MKRTAWIAIALVSLAALGGAGYFGWQRWRTPREPAYGGQTTQAWLEQLAQDDPAAGARAADALGDLGEAGLPVLLEARRASDIRVHRRSVLALARLPAATDLVASLPRGGARVEIALARMGPTAVPALEKGLGDPEIAAHAARVLGEMGPRARATIPTLTALLQDGQAKGDARVAAARALGQIGPEKAGTPEVTAADPVIAVLTAALTGPTAVKRTAAQALARIGPPAVSALRSLAALARDKDVSIASAACEALGNMATPAAAAPLISRLEAGDGASPAAALALARLGPAARTAIPSLIAALKSPKDDGRLARAVLERLGTAGVVDLTEALAANDPGTRRGAAEVLGLLGPRARLTVARLTTLLGEKDPDVALHAAQALIRIDPDKAAPALPVLLNLLKEKDERRATAAALVLPELAASASVAVPELLTALRSKDEGAMDRAASVLGRMRPPAKGVVAALQAMPRPACIRALGQIGPPAKEAVAHLQALLKDPALRAHVALALSQIDPSTTPRAAAALVDDLEAGREPARGRALAALAEMDPPPIDIVPALRPLLGDPALAPAVLRVLERTEHRAIAPLVPDLITLLSATNPRVRELAVALLERGGDRARSALKAAIKSPAPQTRAIAVQALRAWPLSASEIAPVIILLDDHDEQVRREAAWLLAAQGSAALATIQELSCRNEADLRQAGVWGLGKVAAADADGVTPWLLECLVDPDDEVRRGAVDALAALGRTAQAEAVRPLLSDPAPGVRLAAVLAMHRLGAGTRDELGSVLLDLGKTASPAGRRVVLEHLRKIDEKRAGQLLADLDADQRGAEVPDRIAAAGWLVRLEADRAALCVPFLIGVLNGWDARARAHAAVTLGEMGPPARPAVAALQRRQELDEDRDVRLAARHALAQLSTDAGSE